MTALQEHQAVLLELLRELDRVCTAHDIPYVLFAGTALGAARHRGFIPWDDDLDVALLRPDYERLLALDDGCWGEKYFLQREFSPHWPLHFSKLRKNGTTCLEKYRPKDERSHRGIYIDVFPLDNAARPRRRGGCGSSPPPGWCWPRACGSGAMRRIRPRKSYL